MKWYLSVVKLLKIANLGHNALVITSLVGVKLSRILLKYYSDF